MKKFQPEISFDEEIVEVQVDESAYSISISLFKLNFHLILDPYQKKFITHANKSSSFSSSVSKWFQAIEKLARNQIEVIFYYFVFF